MRQRPRQGQRELLPRNVAIRRRRHGRRVVDGNPTFATRLAEKASFLPSGAVKIHLIELHDHRQRRAQLRICRVRVKALREHEAPHVASRAVHEPSFHPLVGCQQHTRIDAETKHGLQSAKLLVVHALRHRALGPLVKRTDAQDRDIPLARKALQALRVVAVGPVLLTRGRLPRVHEQRCILKIPLVHLAALSGRQDGARVPLRQETPVLAGPVEVGHAARDLQEPLGVPLVLRQTLRGPTLVALLINAVRLQKHCDVFELIEEEARVLNERLIARRRRTCVVFLRLVQALARVRASLIHWVVADGRGLRQVPSQDRIQPKK